MTAPPPGPAASGPLLECVPNVSEGRNLEALAALERRLRAVPGVRLLDLAPDPDHHRSVVTLAGTAEALRDGVLALFAWAAEHVDLRNHRGVHPARGRRRRGALRAARRRHDGRRGGGGGEHRGGGGGGVRPARLPLRAGGPPSRAAPAERHPPRSVRRLPGKDRAARLGARLRPAARPPAARRHRRRRTLLPVGGQRPARDRRRDDGTGRGASRARGDRRPPRRARARPLPRKPRLRPGEHEPRRLPPHLARRPAARVEAEARAQGTEVVATELVGLAPAAALLEPLRALLRTDALGTRQIVEWRLLEEESRGR